MNIQDPSISVKKAKQLHQQGRAQELHGALDTGLLKAAVYGANDGIITTFAVVAGVSGAGLSSVIIIILGISNMIADGLSMGIGDYLGERSERRHLKHQFEIEKWEVDNIPEEEKKELIAYFHTRGVSVSDSNTLSEVITKYPELWAELGFVDEMGVAPDFSGQMWRTGVTTFCSFVVAGCLPMMPYFFTYFGAPIQPSLEFPLSIGATVTALFAVGSLRTLITKGVWWKNGLEVLLIGAVAAIVAYALGAGVESLLNLS